MPKPYPPEFRARALALIEAGRCVVDVAADLGISTQALYSWRNQALVDAGQRPGLSTTDSAELRAARAELAQLRDEVAILRRANDLLRDAAGPKGDSR